MGHCQRGPNVVGRIKVRIKAPVCEQGLIVSVALGQNYNFWRPVRFLAWDSRRRLRMGSCKDLRNYGIVGLWMKMKFSKISYRMLTLFQTNGAIFSIKNAIFSISNVF